MAGCTIGWYLDSHENKTIKQWRAVHAVLTDMHVGGFEYLLTVITWLFYFSIKLYFHVIHLFLEVNIKKIQNKHGEFVFFTHTEIPEDKKCLTIKEVWVWNNDWMGNWWLQTHLLHICGSGRKWHNVWGQWEDRKVSIVFLSSPQLQSTVYVIISPCLLSGYSVLNHASLYVSIHFQLH